MTTRTFAFATIGVAALLLPGGAIAGGPLGRADFDRCYQQSMQAAGLADSQAPSASPSTSSTGGGASSSVSGGTASQSGTGATGSSGGSTGGSMSGGTGSSTAPSGSSATGTTGAGATSSTGSLLSGAATASGMGDQLQVAKAVEAYRVCLQK